MGRKVKIKDNAKITVSASEAGEVFLQMDPIYRWYRMTEKQFEKLVEEGRKVLAAARGSQTDKANR